MFESSHWDLVRRGDWSCGVGWGHHSVRVPMSILGEYLQKVKAEREEAVKLLTELMAYTDPGVYQEPAASECCAILDKVDAFLSRYDLPEDYDEA